MTRPGVVVSTPRNRITSDVWVVRRFGRRSHPRGQQTTAPTQFTTRTAAVSVSSRANCGHRQHKKMHSTEPTWPNLVNLDHMSPVVAGRQGWVHARSAGVAGLQANMPAVANNETHTARRLRRWHFRRVYNATLAQLTENGRLTRVKEPACRTERPGSAIQGLAHLPSQRFKRPDVPWLSLLLMVDGFVLQEFMAGS